MFISMRRAASWTQPLHDRVDPRAARTSLGALTSLTPQERRGSDTIALGSREVTACALVKALESSRRLIMMIALVLSCVTPRPPEPIGARQGDDTEPVLDVARAFVTATRARQFDIVWGLLSERWRGVTTVERLAVDFEAEPLALERLRRVEVALGTQPVLDGGVAELPLEPGRALVLLREEGGWHIDRLE